MPNTEPNPNTIERQPTDDSPPPRDQGERMSPDDDADAIEIGHAEAEAQQRTGDAVPASDGTGAGGGSRTDSRVE